MQIRRPPITLTFQAIYSRISVPGIELGQCWAIDMDLVLNELRGDR